MLERCLVVGRDRRTVVRKLFALLIAVLTLCLYQATSYAGVQRSQPPMIIGDVIVLQNQSCRFEIGLDGKNRAFEDASTKRDYCDPGQPFMIAGRGNKTWASSKVELDADIATVTFGDSGVRVKARLGEYQSYLLLTVEEVMGGEVDWLQFCNLRLNISESVGTLVNAAWNKEFAACVLACNDRTDSFGADGARAHLCAKCYREFGFEGASVAIIGVPQTKLLDTIEKVETEQGLPHPVLNGVWIRKAPERFASYLMVHGLGEHNADQVIDVARGGFGCIEIYPWRSTPSYEINPSLFPHGLAGLKKVSDKIHAAGMQLGLHVMQGMVGWGPKDDSYISPKADPRLLQDRHAALAAPLASNTPELTVKEGTTGWPEKGDLYVEGEIIRYGRRTETGFTDCQRGLHGTTISEHPAGATVGHLVNCFPIWGGTVYCPDVKSTLVDEICDRLAHVFNETGADMSYFDGGEELIYQPPSWRNQGRFALGIQKRLKKPVILGGNALYTHLAWHVITRGSPHFDPIYFGRRDYTLRFKGQYPSQHAKNLLTGDVGWFNPHVHSSVVDAVTPDEVLLLCLKAVGHKAPISFQMDMNNPWANRRMPEMLETIRACDELKRRDYFTNEACAEIIKPFAEHTIEQTKDGEWNLRPMQFGPARTLDASRNERSELSYKNPYEEQRPWIRLRARTRLAPYGNKDNTILADFSDGVAFKVAGSASAELTPTIAPSAEKTPDGGNAVCYRAENREKARSGWCQLSLPFPKQLDLTHHRRVGLWVHSEGKGGILNVQLAGKDARMDHYVDLDFVGWRCLVLDPPEDSRLWSYTWPYSWTDLLYTSWAIYGATNELNLFYNDLPPSSTTTCLIGRIEGLDEQSLPLQNPTLEVAGRKITFPVALQPDEYLEMDWSGRCRYFEPNGGLIGEVKPEGILRLATGENEVRFSCDTSDAASPRAEVTLSVRGEPLANTRNKSTAGSVKSRATARGSIYPSLASESKAGVDDLQLTPGNNGGYRLMQGVFERVDDLPARSIAAYDGKSNAWSVENDRKVACRVAVVISRGISSSAPTVNYDDPNALLLEDFEDLAGYAMSDTNQYEKYVEGDNKQLTKEGPVRAGVSQTFTTSAEDARVGKSCAAYIARNDGDAGGWSGVGRKFTKPVDLSKHAAVAFWLNGDGKHEAVRFQFRDVSGKYADWVVPIDFTGWRLQVFRLADAKNFDWKKTEYVLFYYNNLPGKTTCTLRFDGLKAFPKAETSVTFPKSELVINGKALSIPMELNAEETMLIDAQGRVSVWPPGKPRRKTVKVSEEALLLQPGPNQLRLTCDTRKGVPSDVTVRLVRL